MKKILIMCQYFYPEQFSTALLPTQLAEKLVDDGFEVNVICGLPQSSKGQKHLPKKEIYKHINIHRLKYGNFDQKNKIGRIYNFFSFFLAVVFRFPKITNNHAVVVYSNPPILPLIGYWAKRIKKIKFIFIGFDLYPDNALVLNAIRQNGLICKMMKYINKRVYSHADKVVALSSDMKQYMLNVNKQLPESRSVVIPNWYTGEIHKLSNISNDLFRKLRNSYALIVLYSGNMGAAQDLDTVANAIIKMSCIDKYNSVYFVFTGQGVKKDALQKALSEAKVSNVGFFSFLVGQDYIDVMNISDVCLVSLQQGIEGLAVPSKTYGYLAYAKPVISIMSNETELASNIKAYKAGVNIVQYDVDGFISAIDLFIDNPDALRKYGNNALRLHDDHYNKNISLGKYSDMFDMLINNEQGMSGYV